VRITPRVRSDSVSSSRRPTLRFSRMRLAVFSSTEWHCNGETSAFVSAPTRLSPDGPSVERWLGGEGVGVEFLLPASRANRSALTASTIQQLAS